MPCSPVKVGKVFKGGTKKSPDYNKKYHPLIIITPHIDGRGSMPYRQCEAIIMLVVRVQRYNKLFIMHHESSRIIVNRRRNVKVDVSLTAKEADLIVSSMKPRAPWSREQWLQAMEQRGYDIEKIDVYNRCALYTVMNMLMSDSAATLQKYVGGDKLFDVVYSLAVDKLEDEDGNFEVRAYFGLD